MPAFHCPMGAPFYDGEACIDCRLCLAKTKEEMIQASNKIREYIRSEAAQKREVTRKKIAICGKGGTGKSTVVALMSVALKEEGYGVLVIDTDESNPGLYRMLGFDKYPEPLIKALDRFSMGERKHSTEWLTKDGIGVEDIPSEYLIKNGELKFLVVGKISDPFQGCACTMADLVRDFLGKLVLRDKEVVVIDMEAGIESFGRGVERSADTVLIIVEPSFESLVLAERISYMADGIGVHTVRAILNKVPSPKIEAAMKTDLLRKQVRPIGTIFFDSQVNQTGFEGKMLGDSKAKENVKKITKLLLVMDK